MQLNNGSFIPSIKCEGPISAGKEGKDVVEKKIPGGENFTGCGPRLQVNRSVETPMRS